MDFLGQMSPLLSLLTQDCSHGSCISQMERHFYDACLQIGFPYARLSVVSDRAAQTATVNARRLATMQTDSLLFSINFDSFPAEFVAQYVGGQYWRIDTLLRLVQQNMQSTFFTCWHQIALYQGAGQQHALVVDLARRFALNSGVLLSYWNGSRQLVISLGCDEDNDTLQQRVEKTSLQHRLLTLALALNALIDKVSQCSDCVIRARKPTVPDFALTRMQKAILLSYLNDPSASLTSISAAQGISGETVKYHLKCIREKLDMSGASGHVLAHEALHIGLL